MGAKKILFISCGIFKEEIELLLRENKIEGEVVFIDAALHVNFDKLKAKLVASLEEHGGPGKEIKVIYGHCHPDIMEIMDRYGAKKIDAGNCLEAMVGREEIMRINAEATSFFLSAGWVNNWESIFTLGKEDFNFDMREMFANYKRIVVFDTGVIPIDMEKVSLFSSFTGLPVETRKIGLDRLLDLIKAICLP